MTQNARSVEQTAVAHLALRRTIAVVAGAVAVALSAQLSVPIPGSPVPMTFQVPATLIVGGLLGPALGASSLALYLMLGAAGLPVFAPFGVPGLARLFGPTGGYLLALPLAAAIAGLGARAPRRVARLAVSLVLGVVVIHAGGIAQLALLGGDLSTAVRLGSVPFLAGDVMKLLLAGVIVGRFKAPVTRALR
jgi:biotin transport system substrate-specific component